MVRITRFHSFLDRFEERMQMDCERMKRELIAQIDERFGILREKVAQLRNQFGFSGRRSVSTRVELFDDPLVETVDLDEWKRGQGEIEESNQRNVPSASRKRKSNSSTPRTSGNKRQKTVTSNGSNKHQCKSPGCGKSFLRYNDLARHERIHLGIKPFSCTWPGCRYSGKTKANVVQHVHIMHFKLPQRKKEQAQRLNNIVDNNTAEDFVRVDRELLQRRLE